MWIDAGLRTLTDLTLRQAQGEILMLSLSKYEDLPGWLETI